jgi:hypothetical protein
LRTRCWTTVYTIDVVQYNASACTCQFPRPTHEPIPNQQWGDPDREPPPDGDKCKVRRWDEEVLILVLTAGTCAAIGMNNTPPTNIARDKNWFRIAALACEEKLFLSGACETR